MSVTALPDSALAFREARLADIVPFYEDLTARQLEGDEAVEAWLNEWSRLEELFTEAANEASTAYDRDTTDPAKEAADLRFSSEISPRLEPYRVKLGEKLVASGFSRPDLEPTIARWRNRIELFREENVPLVAEEQKLASRYSKVIGGLASDWQGERLPPPMLRPYTNSADRSQREQAYRAFFAPYIDARDELAGIFDALYDLRQKQARNAGFENYRDYMHRAKNRFDYTVEDTLRFQDAVAAAVVPAMERVYLRRARQMDLREDLIRPWDAIDNHVGNPDPVGLPALRPFDTEGDLIDKAQRVFQNVDPVLGEYFGRLVGGGMLDLMSRQGKAPGGYCTTFPIRRLPFIFTNASGVAGDVDTLLHEAGHAFHSFESMKLPFVFQRFPGSEMAEVASMSMELLGAPYLNGSNEAFYSDEEARRARVGHLEEALASIAHIASVDAFQHWIYTSGEGGDRDARDREWLRIRERFVKGVDWSGCEQEQVARWYEQVHFFSYPFYYIEYGIAQMGAFQVWRNALQDQAAAVAAYRRALALGGSRPLPELFAAAGAHLVFDEAGMGELVMLVEEQLASLR
ncbi:MAG: M3 family oligoendopeptidase [Chloroflexi bacterium]|nr:MAG: M3 family oligoendopeptidase [Chloroflexota bacterium]